MPPSSRRAIPRGANSSGLPVSRTSRTIDPEWYAGLFKEAPYGAIRGEISPSYAVLSEEGVAYAARLMPDMKVLFLMRDPVERTLSGAMHELTTAAGSLATPSSAALATALADPRCATRSAYRETDFRALGASCCFGSDELSFL